MKLKPVRIGLWDQYGGSMPSGWTRWLFEQYEFPFEVVFPQTLDAGNLNAKYDVLVFVDGAIPQRDGAARRRWRRLWRAAARPTRSRRSSAAGWDASRSPKTVPEIKKFAENGGTVLTIGSSTAFGYHLGLPIQDALVERSPTARSVRCRVRSTTSRVDSRSAHRQHATRSPTAWTSTRWSSTTRARRSGCSPRRR